MIIDYTRLYVKAGRGGEGCSSSMHMASRKVIGNGGNGGNGGNVVIRIGDHPYDLSKFKGTKKFVASDGGRGGDSNRHGKNGTDAVLEVPEGTIVRSIEGEILADLAGDDKEFIVCRGGRGGEGNFKREYTLPPHDGEEREIVLDYRIPADVAVVGFANSGKTSLVNKLTSKNFRVADYPFTTTSCIWAKCEHGFRAFSVLDCPPLKKSKQDSDPANSFLKHLYRAKIILFLSENFYECLQEYMDLEKEITLFDEAFLEDKKRFYLLTKLDKIDKTPVLDNVYAISSNTLDGVEELKQTILNALNE